MKTISNKKSVRICFVSSLLAGVFCLTAQATLFTYSGPALGSPIPQGGTSLGAELVVSGITIPNAAITSVQLILTFNDNTSLGTTLHGSLNLGVTGTSPSVDLNPTLTYNSGANSVYDFTFTGLSGTPGVGFDGLNPNGTWGLVLWDTGTGAFRNGLVGWSLEINAVPEPTTIALPIFGGVLLVAGAVRRWRQGRAAQAT